MAWYEWPAVRAGRGAAPAGRARDRAAPQEGRSRSRPVTIEGRTIARSFWGKAWCDNLERYSDYANRLPRGRTYVRNGSVMRPPARRRGRSTRSSAAPSCTGCPITIAPLARAAWKALVRRVRGPDRLAGRAAPGEVLASGHGDADPARRPACSRAPREIDFECSCPDWAAMCKHVAAVLYGVGARLDPEPELFFRLRRVDQVDLLSAARSRASLTARGAGSRKRIADTALAEVFGIELDVSAPAPGTGSPPAGRRPSSPPPPRPKRLSGAARGRRRRRGD